MKASEVKKAGDAILEDGVSTKEQYLRAVPMIFEMRNAIKSAKEWLAILNERHNQLSELAAGYAIDHAKALDEPLATVKDGIESGTVEIGGETYRLTISPDAPKRISGGNLTQGFLADLPKDWVKTKLVLHQGALEGTSPDELARYDLKRDMKRVWSVPANP